MNRRKFIRNSLLSAVGLGLSGGIYAWQVEPFWVEFVRKKMYVPNLPENLIGKTIMQFSDLHIGDRFDYQFIIHSFEKTKEYQTT